MALATINGFDIIEADITLPRRGRWSAVVAVDAQAADQLLGRVTVDVDDGQLRLVGTAFRGGAFADQVKLRVVGGNAGMLKQIGPRAYQGVPLRLPLQDALAEVGEALAPTSDAAILDLQLQRWARLRGECMAEVVALLARSGAPSIVGMRFLPDGTLWVGTETWPEVNIDHDLLVDLHWAGQAVIGVEVPTLLPGTTFLGRKVEQVDHHLGGTEVRTVVTFADTSADTGAEPYPTSQIDRDKVFIQRQLEPARFHRTYPGKVVKQNADGSVEVVIDSPAAPGLSKVPLRAFAPGVAVKVAPGSRCQVVFEEGDPQKQAAAHWEPGAGALLELKVQAQTKATLAAPDVRLGSDAATEALILGTTYRAADSAFDNSLLALATALGSSLGAFTASLGTLAANPTPTLADLKTLIGIVSGVNAALVTAAAALGAAASQKELAAAGSLSLVSKTT